MKKAPESGVRIIHPRLMFNLLMYRCMETKNFQVVIKSYLEQLPELDAEFAVKYFDEVDILPYLK